MSDSRKLFPVSITLYTQHPEIKCSLKDIVFTDKSWELIQQGLPDQTFIVNAYIHPMTGKQTLHVWPTCFEIGSDETKQQENMRKMQEELIKKAHYKTDEVVMSPFSGLTGILHTRGAELDRKKYDLTQFPYLVSDSKKTVQRLGGSIRKMINGTKDLIVIGRSTLNWNVFILNEVFEYAYYFYHQDNLERNGGWPLGIHMARSLPFNVIEAWLEAIAQRNHCDTSAAVVESCKQKQFHYSFLRSKAIKHWKHLLTHCSEQERLETLSSLMMKTIYIAAGLKRNKHAFNLQSDENIAASVLGLCQKYGIAINLEYIPADMDHTSGKTALMWAALLGKKQIVEMLLAHGAKIHVRDNEDYTVLDHALLGNSADIYELLLKAGANPVREISPEVLMDEKGKKEIYHFQFFKNFLEDHKDQKIINLTTKTKDTFLHLAVKEQKLKMVELLLEKKLDPNIQNSRGLTPLHVAVENGFAIKSLLKYKADPTIKSLYSRETPLDMAIKRQNIFAISFFLPHLSDTILQEVQEQKLLDPRIKNKFNEEQENRQILLC